MTLEACEQLIKGGFEGNISELIAQCSFAEAFTGGLAGGVIGGTIVALGIIFIVLIGLALYIYTSLAWYTISKKQKYKYPWLAWIPIANIILILQIGSFHWAWILLILIPILGWIALFIIVIIAKWRIFEKGRYPGWFSLAAIIPKVGGLLNLIAIGFLAWGKGMKKGKGKK